MVLIRQACQVSDAIRPVGGDQRVTGFEIYFVATIIKLSLFTITYNRISEDKNKLKIKNYTIVCLL